MASHLRHLPRVVDVARGDGRGARALRVPGGAPSASRFSRTGRRANACRGPASTLIAELQRLGYRVVVSSTSPATGRLEFGSRTASAPTSSPCCGGPTWATTSAPGRWPWPPAPSCSAARTCSWSTTAWSGRSPRSTTSSRTSSRPRADVWGMVECDQFAPHLQSFFRGFRYGVLAEPPMRRFWRDRAGRPGQVRPDPGLRVRLHRVPGPARLLHDPVRAPQRAWWATGSTRPSSGWQALLDAGVPFVKRELVRNPELAPDGHRIAAVIADRYGTDVADWL